MIRWGKDVYKVEIGRCRSELAGETAELSGVVKRRSASCQIGNGHGGFFDMTSDGGKQVVRIISIIIFFFFETVLSIRYVY